MSFSISESIRLILLGCFIMVTVEVVIIIRLLGHASRAKVKNTSRTNGLDSKDRDAWPPQVVVFLKNALDTHLESPTDTCNTSSKASSDTPGSSHFATSSTEPCHWLNALVHRYFLELRVSDVFQDKMKVKLVEKINYKLQSSNFVSQIVMTDINLGDNPPKIHGIRLIKHVSEDLAVMAEFDMTYPGGASVGIDCLLAAGFKVPVRVHVSGFAGKLRARMPSIKYRDSVGVSFVEDPGVTFTVDSPLTVGGIEGIRSMVNGLLARLIRNQFLEYWIIPAWHNVYLPMMVPPPEAVLQRMGIHVNTTNSSTAPSSSTNSRPSSEKERPSSERTASTSGQSRPSALSALRGRNWSNSTPNGDALAAKAFAHTTIIPDDVPGVKALEKGLLGSFLALAQEPDRPGSINSHGSGNSALSTSTAEMPVEGSQSSLAPSSQLSDEWKTVRQFKNEIKIQKKRVIVNGKLCEISRGLIHIACDPDRVYSILSNPEHNRHVDESYTGSNVLRQFDQKRLVRQVSYNLNRTGIREYLVLEFKGHLPNTPSVEGKTTATTTSNSNNECYIIVSRSVAGVRDGGDIKALKSHSENTLEKEQASSPAPGDCVSSSSPSTGFTHFAQHGCEVHLFGYLVSPTAGDPSSCDVTILSNMAPELSRLEVNYNACRRVKTFIEELATLTNMVRDGSDTSSLRRRKLSGANQLSDEPHGKKLDKLKSYVSAAGFYLSKNKKMSSWLGLQPGSGSGGSPAQPRRSSDELDVDDEGEEGFPHCDEANVSASAAPPSASIASTDDDANVGSVPDVTRGVEDASDHPGMQLDEALSSESYLHDCTSISSHTIKLEDDASRKSTEISLTDEDGIKDPHFDPTASPPTPAFLPPIQATYDYSSDCHSIISSPDFSQAPQLPPRRRSSESETEAVFLERLLVPKDFVRLETTYHSSNGKSSEYRWEIRSMSEGRLSVSIAFIPFTREYVDRNGRLQPHEVFPEMDGQRLILAPSTVNIGPGRPAHGHLCLVGFPSGRLVLIIENPSSTKTTRDVTYRGVIQVVDAFKETLNEWVMDSVVGRKARVHIPVIYPSSTPESFHHLQWEFSTNNNDLVFGVIYQPFVETKTKTWEEKLASRLSKSEVAIGEEIVSASEPESVSDEIGSTSPQNEVLVSLMKVNSKSSSISGSLPVTNKYGVYYFVFENTAVIHTRLVSMKVSLVVQHQS
ncbi:hypothetical protein SeLEV6574_g02194 [Synchytrium endobioticum]|uniref:SMP-LTD domain-containing protein n=1 Tax=Synchytrium endobioticum TaxID=286115 RepID=A0A507D9A7_9FUNG|nr:hypothetical protein SeLEV6574_g02194 [Synchytrium endobioticum]